MYRLCKLFAKENQCQLEKKERFQHILLFEVNRGIKPSNPLEPFDPFEERKPLGKVQHENGFLASMRDILI